MTASSVNLRQSNRPGPNYSRPGLRTPVMNGRLSVLVLIEASLDEQRSRADLKPHNHFSLLSLYLRPTAAAAATAAPHGVANEA